MSLAQFWPRREHASRAMTRVAPPAVRSARVAVPRVIFVTRLAFVVVGLGTRHTVASYRSRHTGPAATASGAHVLAAPAALVISATTRTTIVPCRIIVFALHRSSVHEHTRTARARWAQPFPLRCVVALEAEHLPPPFVLKTSGGASLLGLLILLTR